MLILKRILGVVLAGVGLVLAFLFSVVVFAVLAVAAAGVLGWVWWKTRALRREMAQAAAHPSSGVVIEATEVTEIVERPAIVHRPGHGDPAAPIR